METGMKKQLRVLTTALALFCALIWMPGARADYIPENINEIIAGIEGGAGGQGGGAVNTENTEDRPTAAGEDGSIGASADFTDESPFVTATVSVHLLNMRSGPSASHSILRVLKQNETLKVFGKINDWYIVQEESTGTVGCVSGYYITLSDSEKEPEDPSGSSEETALLAMINAIRAQNGLKPLTLNRELSRVALHKAMDMVENNYFSHQSGTYGSPFEMMKKYGIVFTVAAENIAGNQTAEGAVFAWKNSEGHLANILESRYTETGIGIYNSPIYGKIFVEMFTD